MVVELIMQDCREIWTKQFTNVLQFSNDLKKNLSTILHFQLIYHVQPYTPFKLIDYYELKIKFGVYLDYIIYIVFKKAFKWNEYPVMTTYNSYNMQWPKNWHRCTPIYGHHIRFLSFYLSVHLSALRVTNDLL